MRFRTSLPYRRPERRARRLFQPRCLRLEARALLTTSTWVHSSGGDWDTASNWSTNAVPGPADDAVISYSGITVTHNSAAFDTVNSLTCQSNLEISNGELSVGTTSSLATSNVYGQLNMPGGSLRLQSGSLSDIWRRLDQRHDHWLSRDDPQFRWFDALVRFGRQFRCSGPTPKLY